MMVQKICFCLKSAKKKKKLNDKDVANSDEKDIITRESNEIFSPEKQIDDENENLIIKKEKGSSSPTSSSESQTNGQTLIPIIITNVSDLTKNLNSGNPTFNREIGNEDLKDVLITGNGENSSFQVDKKSAVMKATLKVFTTSLEAAEPFFPWIKSVNVIIDEIVDLYESVEYNKKTCLVLTERVELISLSVKTLSRRIEENYERFQEKDYLYSFIKLHKVLSSVKSFIEDASQLKGYRKFLHASDVKDKANNLLSRLERCCNDLQFSIIISQETKNREQQSLIEDVANMTKFLKSIEIEREKINRVYEEVLASYKRISDTTK